MNFTKQKFPKQLKGYLEELKRNGGKVHSLRTTAVHGACSNCDGRGSIMIETIVGGPYEAVPPSNPQGGVTITFIDDKWYQRRISQSPCPVCQVRL